MRETFCLNSPWGSRKIDLSSIDLSTDEKMWFATQINEHGVKAKSLESYYNINAVLLRKYAKRARDGLFLHDGMKGGRPYCISSEKKQGLLATVLENRIQVTTASWNENLQSAFKETAKERNTVIPAHKSLSKRTIGGIELELNVKTAMAEKTTDARAIAVSDIRNAVSFAAMNSYMVQSMKVNPKLILNADASQFKVGSDCKQNIQIKYAETESIKLEGPLKSLPNVADKGITAFFMKYYLLMSAFGDQADPVFVLADSSMDSESIDVFEVVGLGISNVVGGKAWVVFCKTRCYNLQFYTWFNTTVLVPWVMQIRSIYHLSASDIAWFQLDGEPVQIECYSVPAILDVLDGSSIVVGKPPASTTAITQPCDRGNCFKGPKTTNKSISDKDVSQNTEMIKDLTAIYQKHEKTNNNRKISAGHKRMGIMGLLRVQLALQLSMRRTMIQESFKLTGIYPYSLDTILDECSTKIGLEERTLICAALPKLSNLIGQQSELFDKDFDNSNIRKNVDKEKDHSVVYRRRSIILNGKAHLEREEVRLQAEEAAIAEAAEKKRKKKEALEARKVAKKPKK